jgi:hypothetical protein
MNKPITVWERQVWEHNHISDGHITNDSPVPKTNEQKKMWRGVVWRKSFRYLDSENKIVTTED